MLIKLNFTDTMYNGAIIKALLKERNLKIKDLLEELDMNTGGGLRPLAEGDPKASKLEELADFFGVSIDTFFIRNKQPHISVVGNSNNVACLTIGALEEKAANLQALIEEKDKRIELLEIVNEMLRKELEDIKSKITPGQVTDKPAI